MANKGLRRTRKWSFVAQEARRLAKLGLPPKEIASRIAVDYSTVMKWMKAGKLPRTRAYITAADRAPVAIASEGQTPAEWVATVRAAYDLDATDQQLVLLAESALVIARDPKSALHVRMSAAGRFQALVKQLSLVVRKPEEGEKPEAPAKPEEMRRRNPEREARRPAADPRVLLQAVK